MNGKIIEKWKSKDKMNEKRNKFKGDVKRKERENKKIKRKWKK